MAQDILLKVEANAFIEQISWEFEKLKIADMIIF